MDHPSIVKLYEFYDQEEHFCLVQEVVAGGELFDAITYKGKFTQTDARTLIKTLLECLNYVHIKGIVHRDLKPENVLLEPGTDYSRAKIIDFGTAISLEKDRSLTQLIGTPFYMAPEVIAGKYS